LIAFFSVEYKQQELTIMAKLDNVEKHTGKGKKGSIGDAAGENDAIRLWVSFNKITPFIGRPHLEPIKASGKLRNQH